MKWIVLTLCLACAACHSEKSKPLLVVATYGPWDNTLGAGCPSFALYEDGSVICYHQPAWGVYPKIENLFTVRKIENPKKKAEELLSFDQSKAKKHYELSASTCQGITIIWTPTKRVEIYSDWKNPRQYEPGWEKDPRFQDIIKRETEMWNAFPDEIRQSLLCIEKENAVAGSQWLPDKIEVMLIPYEYAPEESIVWPKEWPSLNSKDAKKRSESTYSIFLSSKKLSELENFLATGKPRGAVLIDGKKMSVTYRFPFPHEELWALEPLESFE